MSKTEYDEKYTAYEEHFKALEELTETVQGRIDELHEVGRSVMSKTVGPSWWREDDMHDYFRSPELEWFPFYSRQEIIKLEKEGASFKSKKFSTNPKARALRIPQHVLSLSDREFATLIRDAVKRRREHREHFEFIMADLNLLNNTTQIRELEEENNRLRNIITRRTAESGSSESHELMSDTLRGEKSERLDRQIREREATIREKYTEIDKLQEELNSL